MPERLARRAEVGNPATQREAARAQVRAAEVAARAEAAAPAEVAAVEARAVVAAAR